MATVKNDEGQTQVSAGATQADPSLAGPGPVPEGDAAAFARGQSRGRELAGMLRRRFGAWAEENPGQMIAVALAAGFVAGKIFRRPRPVARELE